MDSDKSLPGNESRRKSSTAQSILKSSRLEPRDKTREISHSVSSSLDRKSDKFVNFVGMNPISPGSPLSPNLDRIKTSSPFGDEPDGLNNSRFMYPGLLNNVHTLSTFILAQNILLPVRNMDHYIPL